MTRLDYLNREVHRAKRYSNPQEHLDLINSIKEQHVFKNIDELKLLKDLSEYLAKDIDKNIETRRMFVILGILIAEKCEKNSK